MILLRELHSLPKLNTIQGIEGSIILMLARGIALPALFISVVTLYDKYHT